MFINKESFLGFCGEKIAQRQEAGKETDDLAKSYIEKSVGEKKTFKGFVIVFREFLKFVLF